MGKALSLAKNEIEDAGLFDSMCWGPGISLRSKRTPPRGLPALQLQRFDSM
jgi:hypothetical protein